MKYHAYIYVYSSNVLHMGYTYPHPAPIAIGTKRNSVNLKPALSLRIFLASTRHDQGAAKKCNCGIGNLDCNWSTPIAIDIEMVH